MTPLDLALMFLGKGKQDEDALRRLVDDPSIADEILGFHVQQALEKYLKAVLAVGETRPTRTHELDILLGEVEDLGRKAPVSSDDLKGWSEYAVRNRYPIAEPLGPIDRVGALQLVETVRTWVEEILRRD